MTYSLEVYDSKKNSNSLFILTLFLMSILLHQSSVLFGINISFADFFCLIILVAIISKKQLLIPITPMIFFILVSIVVLFTAVFYVPLTFMYNPNPMKIMSEYMKLVAILFYFLVGFNLSHTNQMETVLKWYSLFGILIGIFGIFLTIFNIKVFSSILFYGDIRFRGFMNDPNYFSVLQITAFVYISRLKTIKLRFKYAALCITFLSVIVSGSKTGVITLFCYLLFRIVEYVFSAKKKVKVIISQWFLIIILVLIISLFFTLFQTIINDIASSIPAFTRVQQLFTDFDAAISGNGSERDSTWTAALQIIQHSPVIGIGIGTYMNIASGMFDAKDIAHNTLLQLSAEWGIPLAFVFFAYVFYLLGKATNNRMCNAETNYIIRDIIIILLVGSMAISLNNARVLWLLLGALVSSLYSHNIYIKKSLESKGEVAK